MNKHVYFDVFETKHDADLWMDAHIDEHQELGWYLIEAKCEYHPKGWVTSCMFADKQLELDLNIDL